MPSVLAPDVAAPAARELAAHAAPVPQSAARRWPSHILVATHGGRSADQAIAVAQALAERSGARITLVTAFTPRVPVPAAARALRTSLRLCEGPDRPRAARLLRCVHEQQRRLVGDEEMWPIRLGIGDPVRVILEAACDTGADLVVAGIGRPHPFERPGGDQVPIVVAHHLSVPLYAVVDGASLAPARAVLVFPDGEVEPDALRAALGCAAPGAALSVVIPARTPGRDVDPAAIRDAVLAAARATSPASAEPSVEVVRGEGELLATALAVARRADAGLIALPVMGPPGVIRELIPNLAWPLLLTTDRSVLVAPSAPPPCDGGEPRRVG